MKLYRKITFFGAVVTMALAVAIVSCAKERALNAPAASQSVTISLDTRGPEPLAPPDIADDFLSSLRVLIYKSHGGDLAFNFLVPNPASTSTLEILTGKYDFVFIGNENSDPTLKAKLTSVNNVDIDNISKLRTLSFARTAFDPAKNIPMVTYVPQVEVAGDDKIKTPDMATYQTGTWSVPLERAAIRLKLVITLTTSQKNDWVTPTVVTIKNIPSGTYIMPGIDNSSWQSATGIDFSAGAGQPGVITANGDGTYSVVYDRLILPESVLAPANNVAAKALILSMNFGTSGGFKSAAITCPSGDANGYALPRNTYLLLRATVTDDAIEISAKIEDWVMAPVEDHIN